MPKYRGGSGNRLHQIRGLTREEAAHWIVHDRHGRAWARERSEPLDVLVDHLVEASAGAADGANKRVDKEAQMSSTDTILKNAAALGEHGVFQIIQKHADAVRRPGESSAQAFTRVFTEQTNEGEALRMIYQHAKGQGIAASNDVSAGDSDADDDTDALALLEELAAALRRQRPELTKAAAFAKVYCDPNNARLAAKERRQNRPA
jgi:hypothetical protein